MNPISPVQCPVVLFFPQEELLRMDEHARNKEKGLQTRPDLRSDKKHQPRILVTSSNLTYKHLRQP